MASAFTVRAMLLVAREAYSFIFSLLSHDWALTDLSLTERYFPDFPMLGLKARTTSDLLLPFKLASFLVFARPCVCVGRRLMSDAFFVLFLLYILRQPLPIELTILVCLDSKFTPSLPPQSGIIGRLSRPPG